MPFLTKLHKILDLFPKNFIFQNAFQITLYQPPNLYSVVPSGLARSTDLVGFQFSAFPSCTISMDNVKVSPSTQDGAARVVPATCPGKQEHLTVCDRSSILFLLQHLWSATTSQVPVLTWWAVQTKTKDETFRKLWTCPPLFLIRSALSIAL